MSAAEQTGRRQQVTAEMKAVLEQMQAMLVPQVEPVRSWVTQGCCERGGCVSILVVIGKVGMTRRGAGAGKAYGAERDLGD
jgi:hypothetical protein